MDIIAREVLALIQKSEGFENSIIAGGSVRDFLLGQKEKTSDFDIFIPFVGNTEVSGIFWRSYENLLEVLKQKNGSSLKFIDIYNGIDSYSGEPFFENTIIREKFEYKGKVFDLVFSKVDTIDKYQSVGDFIVGKFNFGINMCYFDGFSIIESDKFAKDLDNKTITLYTLTNINHLSHHINKFNKINEKHDNKFSINLSEVLELKKDPSESTTKDIDLMDIYKSQYVQNAFNEINEPRWERRAPVVRNEVDVIVDIGGDNVEFQ